MSERISEINRNPREEWQPTTEQLNNLAQTLLTFGRENGALKHINPLKRLPNDPSVDYIYRKYNNESGSIVTQAARLHQQITDQITMDDEYREIREKGDYYSLAFTKREHDMLAMRSKLATYLFRWSDSRGVLYAAYITDDAAHDPESNEVWQGLNDAATAQHVENLISEIQGSIN